MSSEISAALLKVADVGSLALLSRISMTKSILGDVMFANAKALTIEHFSLSSDIGSR